MTNKSKAKGTRAEHSLIKLLLEYYNLPFKRVPLSGASVIKGDIFLANKENVYCIEVKSYKESALNHLLLSGVGNPLKEWITQTEIQAIKMNSKPLLFFKHDRSKFFVVLWNKPINIPNLITYEYDNNTVYIALAKEWLVSENIEWTL